MKRDIVCVAVVAFLLCIVPMLATPSTAVGAENDPAPEATQLQFSPPPPETSHAQSQPPASSPAPEGVALELSTGELSGGHDAALGLGWGSGRFAVGVGFAFQYSNLTPSSNDEAKMTELALALGPWLRWDIARGLDDRVGVVAAIDIQYCRQSTTLDTDTSPTRLHAAANGVSIRVGPGIRFWATPWFAVGYTTQLAVTTLWGPRLAFTQSPPDPSTDEYEQRKVALVGRFSVLAVF